MEAIRSIFNSDRLFLIAGPCVIENQETPIAIAQHLKELSHKLDIPIIFKASYKKANRSSIQSFTGIGDKAGLEVLAHIKHDIGLAVTTDVHSVEEVTMAAEYVDLLQIPAFLCRQTELLVVAARSGKAVNIKKGQFMSAASMRHVVDKVLPYQDCIALTERGTTFGYQDLVVDYRSLPIMQSFCDTVILDCTHSLQQPNQSSGVTGGNPSMISTIARAGVAVGVNGLFIETHPAPKNALSDGSTMLPLHEFQALIEEVIHLRKAIDTI